ncbi:hypothetical protein [Kitasatospora sp. NPDC098663]|uniref:hypothetical protein n=1 Tax=Kitasatospora sp. NPDC098663 TaxID=3364096 RepID=UPI003821FA0B
MNAFVRASRVDAPSYLCWHGDAPVGKTVLLADYVSRRPPVEADILTFFVSAAHGTNTRAEFEKEIVDQIDDLLGRDGSPVPGNAREWLALFAEAAAKSTTHGRKLLLVVDGLDDDLAWSGLAAESGTPESGTEADLGSGAGRRPVRGSIAALLPARPPSGMRIIVSLRRWVRFPDDLPPRRHPLRQFRHLRSLLPVAGVALIRQPPPDAAALGEPVAGLLAVARGGLRTTDLAELTGFPAERVERLLQGPAGRALMTDDPVFGTYALAGLSLAQVVREELGEAGVLRHTRALLAWSRRWRTDGWPDGTPPYLLAHQLRLLTDSAERAAYVLDLPRLRRLARTAGPHTALAQLDAFEGEIGEASDDDGLAMLVPLCAARSLLLRETHEVPDGAASLFVRLGDAERACVLARSAPTPVTRAVHLADVAVELAYAQQSHKGHMYEGRAEPDVAAVVREAVEWLVHDCARRTSPGAVPDPGTHVRLLAAARTLAGLTGQAAARPLVRAVLQDPAVGTDALAKAAGMLDPERDADVVAVLRGRAETLGSGGMRAQAAAVDLWGALARAVPSLSPYAGSCIEAVCEGLGDVDGLAAVDVLASAASALIALPAKRPRAALELTRRAVALVHKVIEASKDPASSSEEDQAHLGHELAGTLARLAQAAADTGATRADIDDIGRLLETLPEELRVGVLGDPQLERAQWVVEVARNEKAWQDRVVAAAAEEKRRAERRRKDAGRESRTEESEGARMPSATRRGATSRRLETHRRSAGLPSAGDDPHPDHPSVLLLLEAEDQLGTGNLLRSRELLETALRNRSTARPSTPANSPHLTDGWTVDLCQAMGALGRADEAEALARSRPGPHERARHLAALSLGCSLAGHDSSGTRHAREAARLMPDGATPELANAVAQALAHTGDEPAALAMVQGRTIGQQGQALTAVAVGLVRHCPEGAARVTRPLIENLVRRMDAVGLGSPPSLLPELAALHLAFPDVRRPDPMLSDALHRAVLHLTGPSLSWSTRPMAVPGLLARLGCLPEAAVDIVESSTARWRRSFRPGQDSSAELALLAAVDGDTSAVWRYADAARTPEDRSTTLRTAALYLAGGQVALTTDSRAEDRTIRTCLALARVHGGGSPTGGETARHIVLRMLKSDAWTHTIPLLPALAPGALGHLGAIAGARAGIQKEPTAEAPRAPRHGGEALTIG